MLPPKKFTTLDELTEYIDKNKKNKVIARFRSGPRKGKVKSVTFNIDNDRLLELNGNEIDCAKIIKKYRLKYSGISYENDIYKFLKNATPKKKGTFLIGPRSMYGHSSVNFNISNHCVIIKMNQKTNYESRYKSKIIDNFNAKQPYVVLDIETTGLSPLVDDIIQIAIYESENNHIVKYLPLVKKSTNTGYETNHISDEELSEKTALTQEEVDKAIEQFDLANKPVVIYTGKNYFDRTFLEVYFLENNLSGLEKIHFFNAKSLVEALWNDGLYPYECKDKDTVAQWMGINTDKAHTAPKNCIIEKEIIEKIPSLRDEEKKFGMQNCRENDIVREIYNLVMSTDYCPKTAENLYNKYCHYLKKKHGRLSADYDCPHRTRGAEWLSIHHIDEIEFPDIATLTNKAIEQNDIQMLDFLKPHNRKDRLTYADQIEHFLLHALIFLYNHEQSGAPHFLFGEILKQEIGIFDENSKERRIQYILYRFFRYISFEEICSMYKKIVAKQYRREFWKLNEYAHDDKILENIEAMLI